jgi:hypothetical protein
MGFSPFCHLLSFGDCYFFSLELSHGVDKVEKVRRMGFSPRRHPVTLSEAKYQTGSTYNNLSSLVFILNS